MRMKGLVFGLRRRMMLFLPDCANVLVTIVTPLMQLDVQRHAP